MGYFFTSDEHYNHKNIIKYCNRPFNSIEEMNEVIIKKHNEVVNKKDRVIHAGDFCFEFPMNYIKRLNGEHTFIRGCHDNWMSKWYRDIWQKTIDDNHIVVCHYSMRVWPRSHYNSWQLYGHSHSGLEPVGKQWDISVDNNNFYPVSYEQIVQIMKDRPNNFNYLGDKNKEL